jgi:hypothetical protein
MSRDSELEMEMFLTLLAWVPTGSESAKKPYSKRLEVQVQYPGSALGADGFLGEFCAPRAVDQDCRGLHCKSLHSEQDRISKRCCW